MKIKLKRASSKRLSRMKTRIVKESAKAKKQAKHRRGRPSGGIATFTKAMVDAIPDECKASDIARALGVERASIQQWWERDTEPLPFTINEKGRRMFAKEEVVAWLVATGRYKARKKAA